ncbi:MAG: hypothetical protein AB7V53_15870 [Dongiaceae bacterium]
MRIAVLAAVLAGLPLTSKTDSDQCRGLDEPPLYSRFFVDLVFDEKTNPAEILKHSGDRSETRFVGYFYNIDKDHVIETWSVHLYIGYARAPSFFMFDSYRGSIDGFRGAIHGTAEVEKGVGRVLQPNFIFTQSGASRLESAISEIVAAVTIPAMSSFDDYKRPGFCAVRRFRRDSEILQTVAAVADDQDSENRARCFVTALLIHYGLSNFDRILDGEEFVQRVENGRYVIDLDWNPLSLLYAKYEGYEGISVGMNPCEVACVVETGRHRCSF